MEKQLHIISLDHGNGHVKGKSGTRQFSLVSGFARPEDFAKGLEGESKFDLDTFSSNKFEDEVYVWGRDVRKGSNLISTYTSEDRYQQKAYKLLTEFALASLVNEDIADVILFTGVPSREKGTKSEEDLIKAFKGTHVVTMNGQTKVINVHDVKVLNQPLGTALSMYFGADSLVKDESYGEKKIAIVDIGSGTTDIDCLDALSIVEEDRDTIPKGMLWAYRKIADYINKENPNAAATPQKVEQQINGDSYVISDRASVDIRKIKKEAFSQLTDDLINGINQRWTNRSKFDRILITGGGAALLYNHFKDKWEKDIILVDQPQMANVIGFYRYGQFYLKQKEAQVSVGE